MSKTVSGHPHWALPFHMGALQTIMQTRGAPVRPFATCHKKMVFQIRPLCIQFRARRGCVLQNLIIPSAKPFSICSEKYPEWTHAYGTQMGQMGVIWVTCLGSASSGSSQMKWPSVSGKPAAPCASQTLCQWWRRRSSSLLNQDSELMGYGSPSPGLRASPHWHQTSPGKPQAPAREDLER